MAKEISLDPHEKVGMGWIKERPSWCLLLPLLLTGCGDSPGKVVSEEIPVLSTTPRIQQAFEVCVKDTRSELNKDNPRAEADIRAVMYSGALKTCESAVVVTCEKDLTSGSCQVILDIYQP